MCWHIQCRDRICNRGYFLVMYWLMRLIMHSLRGVSLSLCEMGAEIISDSPLQRKTCSLFESSLMKPFYYMVSILLKMTSSNYLCAEILSEG